jgi:RNA-directed DNA polymerase
LIFFNIIIENELFGLYKDLNRNTYKHGGYRKFIVTDNKTREISVASVRDRVVHRFIYDYLTEIFDKTFIFDAWSCRKGKGLIGCINRAQGFIGKYSDDFVWRGDIRKFFDNVDHSILFEILKRKIRDEKALSLFKEVIDSFEVELERGIPIGNLTSQIFSNIYLNELDRFIKHELRVKCYLRYGDDFIVFSRDKDLLNRIRKRVINFVESKLKLKLHAKNNLIVRTKHGLRFLGVILYPNGRKLSKRNKIRIRQRLNSRNASSYWGIVLHHSTTKKIKNFQWDLLKTLLV